MEKQHAPLLALLDEYVERFNAGTVDSFVKSAVLDALEKQASPEVFRVISIDIWEKYSVVDVNLAIQVLRKWLHLEPSSQEAKRTLGSYLLAHGPDWDQEGRALLEAAQREG